eukprot:gene12610-14800_t
MSGFFKRKQSKEDLPSYASSSPLMAGQKQMGDDNATGNTSPSMAAFNGGNFKTSTNNPAMDMIVQVFGIDLRSMALLRVGMSVLIMLDLYVRSLYLKAHYTDLGATPVSTVIDASPYLWSIYFINSSQTFVSLLFIINAIAAFSMLIGYRTRISNFICWMLMVSLHVRNSMVLNGGDDFFRLMVFWMLFLPLEAKCSIDSVLNVEALNKRSNINNAKSVTYNPVLPSNSTFAATDSSGKYFLSFATVAIMGQFAAMYFFTAILKTGVEWVSEYSAVWYALNLDQFVTPLGVFIREHIQIGIWLTWATLLFEWYGSLLFFVPIRGLHGPIRTFGVLGFWALHIGFGSCMELGFFMYIPGIASFMFLPAWFWDTLLDWVSTTERTSAVIYYNGSNEPLRRVLSIYKTMFLMHSTPLLAAQRQDQEESLTSLQYEQSIYDEMRTNDSWIAVENSVTLERRYGFNAFIQLIRLSPILRLLSFILQAPIFKVMYQWIVNKPLFINGTSWSFIAHLYPSKPVVVFRSVPESIRWIGPSFKVDQFWTMFSPCPSKDDGWLVIPGVLVDGSLVDVYNGGGEVSYSKPELISAMFPTQRWRKFLMNLQSSWHKEKRLYYGRYLCREWNWYGRNEGDKQLKSFKIMFMLEMTPPLPLDGVIPPDPIPEAVELWAHQCF